MENTTQTTSDLSAENFIIGFMQYTLEKEKKPTSAYQLAKFLGIEENSFYDFFSDVNNLESAIWVFFFEQTYQKLQAEEVYAQYSIREKLLAFYFTWLETLKRHRSYILFTTQMPMPEAKNLIPKELREFRNKFKEYINELLAEGKETGEIATRLLIDRAYPLIFWTQALLILRFWLNDNSKGFEQTDAYIEKAVNFGFDVMGKTFFDSAFDFAKFAFQNRK